MSICVPLIGIPCLFLFFDSIVPSFSLLIYSFLPKFTPHSHSNIIGKQTHGSISTNFFKICVATSHVSRRAFHFCFAFLSFFLSFFLYKFQLFYFIMCWFAAFYVSLSLCECTAMYACVLSQAHSQHTRTSIHLVTFSTCFNESKKKRYCQYKFRMYIVHFTLPIRFHHIVWVTSCERVNVCACIHKLLQVCAYIFRLFFFAVFSPVAWLSELVSSVCWSFFHLIA